MAKSTVEVLKLLKASVQKRARMEEHKHLEDEYPCADFKPDCPTCARNKQRDEALRAFNEWAAVPENAAALAALE